jgi:hypothetical protein
MILIISRLRRGSGFGLFRLYFIWPENVHELAVNTDEAFADAVDDGNIFIGFVFPGFFHLFMRTVAQRM